MSTQTEDINHPENQLHDLVQNLRLDQVQNQVQGQVQDQQVLVQNQVPDLQQGQALNLVPGQVADHQLQDPLRIQDNLLRDQVTEEQDIK